MNQLSIVMTTTMKKIVLLFVGIACLALISRGQSVEEELGFKYVKAKYLMDTERYEDAIRAFTAIIKQDEDYEDALLYRAEAKYAMAAYKGTKLDVLEYASYHGMNERALVLLGKSDYKMKNNKAALNSLILASTSVVSDGQVFEYIGNIFQGDGKLLKACSYWEEGAAIGSSKCESKSRKVCGSTSPSRNTDTASSDKPKKNGGLGKANSGGILDRTKNKKTDIDIKGNEKEDKDDKPNDDEKETDVVEVETSEEDEKPKDGNYPPEDNTPNDITIDEELSITIYGNGLGLRKILDQPTMFIVSETSGEVAVDICINARGKVESAELNADLSDITKQSLISVAIRKAKDFWFEKSDYKEQCGVMVFKIVGS